MSYELLLYLALNWFIKTDIGITIRVLVNLKRYAMLLYSCFCTSIIPHPAKIVKVIFAEERSSTKQYVAVVFLLFLVQKE